MSCRGGLASSRGDLASLRDPVRSVVRPQTGDGTNDTAIELTMGAGAGYSTARRVDGELSGLPIRGYCTGSRMLNLLSKLADILMFSKYRRI